MKIALFSDIHANLPALQAVLADIDLKAPDVVYCLGDLVGYNVWPNEVVEEIRSRRIPTIAGNYDFGIGRGIDECGCAYKTEEEKANGKMSIAYTNEVVNSESRQYLRTLPAHLRVEFQLNDDRLDFLMVHGSPRKINEYLFEDREEKSLLRILRDAHADILCFGHTHKPFHRVLAYSEGVGKRYCHAINIGSVGKPKDGDPRACYAMLTVAGNANSTSKEAIKVEFIRVEYDVERAARAVEASRLPSVYATSLRQGK